MGDWLPGEGTMIRGMSFCHLPSEKGREIGGHAKSRVVSDLISQAHIWSLHKKTLTETSLVIRQIRICLPMQGTWVQPLVWEDSTFHRATKPNSHNSWACTLEPALLPLLSPYAHSLCALQLESSLHSSRLEKAHAQQCRPSPGKGQCYKQTLTEGILRGSCLVIHRGTGRVVLPLSHNLSYVLLPSGCFWAVSSYNKPVI